MTKEEKLAILAEAEARCYEALKTAEVGKDMASIVGALEDVEWRIKGLTGERDEYLAKINTPVEQPDAPAVKEPVKLDPMEEPKPVESGRTFAEVKREMIRYQTNHNVDIAALMQSMGYSKLSEIPAEKYDELIGLADAKAKENG